MNMYPKEIEYKKTSFFYIPNLVKLLPKPSIDPIITRNEERQKSKEHYIFQHSLNISINYKQFSILNVNFLDTKENIVINGSFTKVIYSNENFSMNGIYIHIPIEFYSTNIVSNKTYIYFDPQKPNNIKMIQELSNIESQILNYYYDHIIFKNNQNAIFTLQKSLSSGCIKLFKELRDKFSVDSNVNNINNASIDDAMNTQKKNKDITKTFILKISGIWNNYQDYGLTYKLFPGFNKILGIE